MKTIIFIILTFLPYAGSPQTKEDSLLFQVLNHFRLSHKLALLTWDTSTYREARSVADDPATDSVFAKNAADLDGTFIYAGMGCELIGEVINFDGELDTASVEFIAREVIINIDTVVGESLIIRNPRANIGACVLTKKTKYVLNPNVDSRVKYFQEWVITLVIGMPYH